MTNGSLFLKLTPKISKTTIIRGGGKNVTIGIQGNPGPAGSSAAAIIATVATTSSFGGTLYGFNAIEPQFIFPGGGLSIDGHTLQVGDTVFVAFPFADFRNGLWVCAADGIADGNWLLTRDPRMQTASQIQNAVVIVGPTGSTLKYSEWVCANVGTVVMGTTTLLFKQINATGDANFVYSQGVAASTWNIAHNLGKRPSVTVVDSAGDVCVGNVHYVDNNNVQITFSASFAGSAYLN